MELGQRHRIALRIAAAACLAVIHAPAAQLGRVSDIRFWTLDGATRVAVEVTGEFKLRSDRLYNPDRVFFDIEGIQPANRMVLQRIPVGDSLLKQIRVAETQPGTTRVVLDLEPGVDFTWSQLSSPERLIIELREKGSARRSLPPVPSSVATARTFRPPEAARPNLTPVRIDAVPPRVAAKVDGAAIPLVKLPSPPAASIREVRREPSIEAVRTATPRETPAEMMAKATSPRMPPASPAAPAKKMAHGEASLTRALGLKLGRVVIDAGHGGHDVGTQGPTGLLEKDLVLDIAKRLATLVETRMGSEVVLTRPDDQFVPLEMRPRIANDHKADLFISIHANSSPVRGVSGAETYYLNFTTSRTALEVAARENAASEHSISDLQDLVQQIARKEKLEESREFATKVQESMAALSTRSNAGAKDRGVKKAPFVVLIGTQMPAILAEVGFVTNARDEAIMKRPEHRQKIAEALYRGVSQYASGLSHFQVARSKTVDDE